MSDNLHNDKYDGKSSLTRPYPPNKVRGSYRYILKLGSYLRIPKNMTYDQYLMTVLLPTAINGGVLANQTDKSVFKKLWSDHLINQMSGPAGRARRITNGEVYITRVASDIELLYLTDNLPAKIVKRLNTGNDGEMRGVIYEISVAAAHVRAGYDISWLDDEARPEFIAMKNDTFEVEAKRRNRVATVGFDISKELMNYGKRIHAAQKKKTDKPLIIFVDTDLSPRSSKHNDALYQAFQQKFGQSVLNDDTLIITNMGYEHDANTIYEGNDSFMVIRGNNAPLKPVIDEILMSYGSQLPTDNGSDWTDSIQSR